MKPTRMVLGIAIVIWTMAVILVPAARAATTSEATPESLIDVTGITLSPEVFMRGDTGTVTVEIENTGESAVSIGRAKLFAPSGITVTNYKIYDTVGTLGPGHSMSFTYSVRVNAPDGIYYPEFYLDFVTGGSLRQSFPLKVDCTDIQVSILDAPDRYATDSRETISLSLGNPRETSVTGMRVTLEGEHVRATQNTVFLGTLAPDAEKNATFEITPSEDTRLTFNVSYRNGLNTHFTTLPVEVTVGGRSMAAVLVVNNIEVAQGAGTITVTGDVTNAGLDDAYSIQVTVGSPAKPVDPYPVDVIGALEPDDFSSFEVTFQAQGMSTVPLIVEYRDDEGTILEKTVTISLASGFGAGNSTSGNPGSANPGFQGGPPGSGSRTNRMGPFGSFGSGFSQIPFLQIALVGLVAVVAVVAWRKGYLGKIRNRVSGKSRK
ncbi:MAG: hypothetical protein LUQ42_02460 [Methanomicrobiales archaeon]|nr:hypothetical protein [Methanomicrobiales archaeon]